MRTAPGEKQLPANNSASIAENLLFAAPADSSIGIDTLASDPDIEAALKESGLYTRLLEIGQKIAETMVELFANISDDSGLLGDYSFITQDELPEFERILRAAKIGSGKGGLTPTDEQRLIGLAFKLIPARHRLGVLDDDMRGEIVAARATFHKRMDEAERRFVVFDRDRFVAPMTIEDNLLFGAEELSVDVGKIVRHAADIDNFNISVPRVRNVGGMLLNRQANSLKSADAHIKTRANDTSRSLAGPVEKYASMM